MSFVDLAFVATAVYLDEIGSGHGPGVAGRARALADWTKTGSQASVDALMNSWCTRLDGTPSITLPQAMALKQTIQDLSFESTLSAKTLAVVEGKVMATAAAASPSETPAKRKEESKPQTLLKPENFLTVTEWSVLQKGPAPARLEALLRRYLLLGITNLSEQTVKRGMAFLLALAAPDLSQMPTYEDMYEEVQVFKRSWESLKQDAGPSQVGLLAYPDDPSSLPKALFDRAYRTADPPMGKDVRAGIWLAHIPMRSTSKLLKKNRKGRLPKNDGKALSDEQTDEFQSRMEQCFRRLERLLVPGTSQNAHEDGGGRQLQLAAGTSILQRRTASDVVICFVSSHSAHTCPCLHLLQDPWTTIPYRRRHEQLQCRGRLLSGQPDVYWRPSA